MNNKRYLLLHDTPEIAKNAELKYNLNKGRYEVINLWEVARYPLTSLSNFTFHKDVVEGKPYWFELLHEEDEDECDCDCHN